MQGKKAKRGKIRSFTVVMIWHDVETVVDWIRAYNPQDAVYRAIQNRGGEDGGFEAVAAFRGHLASQI